MKKISILIVDDDPGMTETLADILTDIGYDVAVAGNGYQAIEIIKEKKYDIAFIDIKMPGINGVETFQKMKQFTNLPKVVMMTAYSVEDLVEKSLEEGAYTVVYKPLDIKKLVNLIEKIKMESETDKRLDEFFSDLK
jgi:two-component system response regulator HydG